jgi:hypothetical protein
MTKNARRALFLVVATVGNFLVTAVILVALILAWSAIAGALGIAQSTVLPAFVIAFVAAVVLSFFIYGKFLKYVAGRPDLEERFGLLKK